MSRSVRCKFRCNEVTKSANTRSEQVDGVWTNKPITLYGVKMTPVYSDKPDSENKKFWEFTPSGIFEMQAIHEGMFEPGKEYYIDITPADAE